MAQINDIINELNTLATAFSSVNSFYFDEIGHINDDRSKAYPCILVDSRNIDIKPTTFNRSNMPNKVVYGFKLFFLDDYPVSEQKTTTRQDKYSEIETIANQFLAEIKKRGDEYSTLNFTLKSREVNNGFIVDKVHNDSLVQLVYDVSFEAIGECVQGTFSDVAAPPLEVATITINGVSFTTVAPFLTEDIPVKDTDGLVVGEKIGDEWIVPSVGVCSDATVENSTQTYQTIIASGGY